MWNDDHLPSHEVLRRQGRGENFERSERGPKRARDESLTADHKKCRCGVWFWDPFGRHFACGVCEEKPNKNMEGYGT